MAGVVDVVPGGGLPLFPVMTRLGTSPFPVGIIPSRMLPPVLESSSSSAGSPSGVYSVFDETECVSSSGRKKYKLKIWLKIQSS